MPRARTLTSYLLSGHFLQLTIHLLHDAPAAHILVVAVRAHRRWSMDSKANRACARLKQRLTLAYALLAFFKSPLAAPLGNSESCAVARVVEQNRVVFTR